MFLISLRLPRAVNAERPNEIARRRSRERERERETGTIGRTKRKKKPLDG